MTTTTATRKPHREFCGICHHVSRVSFWVPTDVWQLALHQSHWNEVVCLSCFTEHADERGVDWSVAIEFHCASYALLERQRAAWAAGRVAEPTPRIGNIGGTTDAVKSKLSAIDFDKLSREAGGVGRDNACNCTDGRCGAVANVPESWATAWLVEWPLRAGRSEYWAGGAYFSPIPDDALRFARQEDAEKAIKRDPYLAGTGGQWKAIEHMWDFEGHQTVSSKTSNERTTE